MTTIILQADAARLPLPDDSVDMTFTSGPYADARHYGDKKSHARGAQSSITHPLRLLAASGETLRILSLGAGVQSTALLLMSCRGVLPKLDHAIFADTQWEPAAVYTHLEWLKGEASDAGIPVHTVTAGNLREDVMLRQSRQYNGKRRASMPLFVLNPDKTPGMIRRQCTSSYKIEPIERFILQDILGFKKGSRRPKEKLVEQWMGISADEPQRMRDSRNAWSVNVYPFCGIPYDYLPSVMNRLNCIMWLERNYPGQPIPRSACIGCPFHSNEEWRQIKSRPNEWADAVAFDRDIRISPMTKGAPYLHADRVPLDEVDLRTDADHGQGSLWASECEGMCGV